MYPESTLKRFWSKVKLGSPDECWEWQASKKFGYGKYYRIGGGYDRAHRIAWQMVNGPIPEGLLILHKCNNPACVNFTHLYLGTHKDNARDRTEHGVWIENRPRGSQHGNSKLTESDVLEIRKLYNKGIGSRALGRIFKITKTQILNIVNRRQWKHL